MYRVEKEHEIIIKGEKISFRTICQDYPVRGADGKVVGTVFSYEYIRLENGKETDRPVLFAYNGGPGSSSLWLHMGILAPWRVDCRDLSKLSGSGNYRLEENPDCPLNICDIVVLDPVATGYGQILDSEGAKSVFGFEEDAWSIAGVIEDWIIAHKRYDSKKYLLGESYGTNRNTAVANILMGGYTYKGSIAKGIAVDGILNLGSDISVERFADGEPMDDFTENLKLLPSYAATNWYHRTNQEQTLPQLLEEVYDFCSNEYLRALYLGHWMADEERRSLAEKLAALTGLSAGAILHNDLRIPVEDFVRQYAEEDGARPSLYDARYAMAYTALASKGDCVGDDELMGRCMPGFLGAFHRMEKDYLGIDFQREYRVINFNVNETWSMDGAYTPFQHLQLTLRRNENFRVFFANGAYDLITPIGNVRFTASRLKAKPGQVVIREYPSGHMPYIAKESDPKLSDDIRSFIKGETM